MHLTALTHYLPTTAPQCPVGGGTGPGLLDEEKEEEEEEEERARGFGSVRIELQHPTREPQNLPEPRQNRVMSTLRRSARTAANRNRTEPATAKPPQPEPEPEQPERTAEPAQESSETGPVTSDMSPEKENRVNPNKPSGTTAHAHTLKPAARSIPLGKPKSGRVWKTRSKQRFSALLRDKPLRSSWQKKMEAKREKDLVRKYQQQIKDQKAQEKQEKRKRREENLRRREENERKAEIVQVIRNTTKLKRMKKKQLRKVEKRDTLAALQKTSKKQ